MKKLFQIFLIILLATTALSACGVPQEDYDKVLNDLNAAQTQIQKLEADLASAQSEVSQLKEENESLRGELETAVEEYKARQADHDELNTMAEEMKSNLETAYVYEQIVIELILPAITGDELTSPAKINRVKDLVDEVEDESLKEKFNAWEKSPANRTWAAELLYRAMLKLEELVFYN